MYTTNPICDALANARQAALESVFLSQQEKQTFVEAINKLMQEKHCDGRRQ
ncbi:MAG: hypothetical protein HC836_38290 [Richelia sp. RM2_1_2]|nr:hypothetical protein [Richelia sp. RM1_1_1]NJO63829.1 hypothetical protein [Richelia sp. RM2_1_2]